MQESIKQPGELELRAIRDAVFEHGSSQENWDGCMDSWMRPEETKWLQDEYAKLKAKEAK
jgi:hypothetical protein